MRNCNQPVGDDRIRRIDMTTLNTTTERAEDSISIMTILSVAAAGFFLIYFAGFAEASVFHDAAHDTRHTLAFPCH